MELMPDYPIETSRLRLRPFKRGDVDAVFAYRSREDVAEFLFDEPMSREACAEAIQIRVGQISLVEEGDKIVLAVERREDGELIGEVSLFWRDAEAGRAEVGYILHPAFQRQGYATEAARAMVSIAFSLGMQRVFARCDARNIASARVMERLGMRMEAHLREHNIVRGGWDEELVYAVLAEEWIAASAAQAGKV